MGAQASSKIIWKTAITAVVAAVSLFCLAPWATAETTPPDGWPCAGDFFTFCGDIEPGSGRLGACFTEHQNDMSSVCRAYIAQMKLRNRAVKELCKDDTKRFCKDVQNGKGKVLRCLRDHAAELSTACREKLPSAKK